MKKFNILLAGLIFTPMAFAGGYGLTTPIRLENAPKEVVKVEEVQTEPVVVRRTTKIPRNSLCGRFSTSRWYECDTQSVLFNRLKLRRERISGDLIPTLQNRATRGQDLEREFDRQAAARNKMLRYRRAFSR